MKTDNETILINKSYVIVNTFFKSLLAITVASIFLSFIFKIPMIIIIAAGFILLFSMIYAILKGLKQTIELEPTRITLNFLHGVRHFDVTPTNKPSVLLKGNSWFLTVPGFIKNKKILVSAFPSLGDDISRYYAI